MFTGLSGRAASTQYANKIQNTLFELLPISNRFSQLFHKGILHGASVPWQ